MTRLSATETARNFSDVLNRVAAGEQIQIIRNGSPVAEISPVASTLMPAERFRELMASAPTVDEDFASDVRAVRKEIGPPQDSWPS